LTNDISDIQRTRCSGQLKVGRWKIQSIYLNHERLDKLMYQVYIIIQTDKIFLIRLIQSGPSNSNLECLPLDELRRSDKRQKIIHSGQPSPGQNTLSFSCKEIAPYNLSL
jgi:hypothetical protein